MDPDQQDEFINIMDEIGRTHMPYGKFGPKEFPPHGVPLYDLPYEYLAWFARKGFPERRLGELMRYVYLAKLDGADAMFDVFRTDGKTSLKKPRRKNWTFSPGESSED